MLFLFDNFALDTERRELRRGADSLSVEPQVFDLLEYLIRNRDHVVSKDDMIATVWNGRVVSEATLTSRISAARVAVGDNGDDQRLIRTIFRKGVRFVGQVEIKQPVSTDTQQQGNYPSLPDKPSIAVLPFENMSGDREQEYFADGMVEEIITALSRFSGLFVIARNSSFSYKGRAVNVTQVGRELGVRYVLEGSVRKALARVRITGQLIDAATGAHLWAERFDGDLDDVFGLQDRVAASVVSAIAPKLEQAEIERVKHKPTGSLHAYDCYLRGKSLYHQFSEEANGEALRLFRRAIDVAPDFAAAYGMAASCHAQRNTFGWVTDRQQESDETRSLAGRAVELGQDDAVALSHAAYAYARIVGDVDTADALVQRALALNPNPALAWYGSGLINGFLGRPKTAVEHARHGMRLSPVDPFMFMMQSMQAFAHLVAAEYDEAVSCAEHALRAMPRHLPALRVAAASSALTGRMDQARRATARLLQLDPAFRVSMLKDITPLRRPEDLARYADGLRKAGLPE